jgi:hypothetical protein
LAARIVSGIVEASYIGRPNDAAYRRRAAPAEPALGALDEVLPDEAPPADPPLPPPPPPPPPLCAKPGTGDSRTATSTDLQDNEWDIGKNSFRSQRR